MTTVESKLKLRIAALSVAAFVVLAFLVGLVYTIAITLLAFLLWKAYSQINLMRWWKGQSALTQKISEFAAMKLDEGVSSNNLWVRTLTNPDLAEILRDYRVEVMARPMVIEKQSSDVVKGWTDWGSTRLKECVLSHDAEELSENGGTDAQPVPLLSVLIAKTAFEITVAEHALSLLGVSNPRQVLSQSVVARSLAARKSELDIAWAFDMERTSLAMGLLSKELGETK